MVIIFLSRWQHWLPLARPLPKARRSAIKASSASGGSPAGGEFDIRFALYSTSDGGSIRVGPVTNSAVVVSNGLFTAPVDFGAGVFDGTSYWLELAVRTNGTGNFTTLSPRQQIMPLPYAIYAPNAGWAATATTAASADSVSAANITGVILNSAMPTNPIFSGTVVASGFTGDGGGLTNLATVTNTVYVVGKGAYGSIHMAEANSSPGDFVHVMPGWYDEGTNVTILQANQTLYFEPGAVMYSSYNALNNLSAILVPADNCRIYNPTVYHQSLPGVYAYPIGAGLTNAGFTNVYIYNAYVTNDSDAFCLFATASCSWTLVNPRALTGWDVYAQGCNTNHHTVIINPYFSPRLPSSFGSITRRCIVLGSAFGGGGYVTVIGGFLDMSGGPSDWGNIGMYVGNQTGFITAVGTVVNIPDSMTNTLSWDANCSLMIGDTQTHIALLGVQRGDGLPLKVAEQLDNANIITMGVLNMGSWQFVRTCARGASQIDASGTTILGHRPVFPIGHRPAGHDFLQRSVERDRERDADYKLCPGWKLRRLGEHEHANGGTGGAQWMCPACVQSGGLLLPVAGWRNVECHGYGRV